jgi:hypothetical protein
MQHETTDVQQISVYLPFVPVEYQYFFEAEQAVISLWRTSLYLKKRYLCFFSTNGGKYL